MSDVVTLILAWPKDSALDRKPAMATVSGYNVGAVAGVTPLFLADLQRICASETDWRFTIIELTGPREQVLGGRPTIHGPYSRN